VPPNYHDFKVAPYLCHPLDKEIFAWYERTQEKELNAFVHGGVHAAAS
jgi:hypothetical protein